MVYSIISKKRFTFRPKRLGRTVSLAFWKIVSWKVSLAERNCFFHPPTLHGNERWAVFGKRRPKNVAARSITLACRGRCFSQIKVAGTSVISAGLYGYTNVIKPGGGRASQIIRLKAQGLYQITTILRLNREDWLQKVGIEAQRKGVSLGENLMGL